MGVTARRTAARIVLAGVSSASVAPRAYLRAELDDVTSVTAGDVESGRVASALREADMLVIVADSHDVPDAATTERLAAAAHDGGMPVAALVVGAGAAGASALLGALREAADMVMVVRDVDDARAVIAALR